MAKFRIACVPVGKGLTGYLVRRRQPYILWGTPRTRQGKDGQEQIYGFFANKEDAELALADLVKRGA